MKLTMFDAKVCNAATQTYSTMSCCICGATNKQFSDLAIKNEIKSETLKFGLSILKRDYRIIETDYQFFVCV